MRVLEDLKSAMCAEQAQLAVDLDASQRSVQESAGVAAGQQGRGVAAQVALARRESPHRGQVLLGLGKVLTREMPHTLDRLADGTLSEYAAIVLAKETACLTLVDRQTVDQRLCADSDALVGWGIRRLAGEARRLAQTLDAAACVRRATRARSERCVTLRPAPDTMTYLTALLPVEQGVAVYAALCAAAATVVAGGDTSEAIIDAPRSRGQIMADTLVERLTGQVRAADVPLTVDIVISDEALFDAGRDPAVFAGGFTVPAALARHLVAGAVGGYEARGAGDGAGEHAADPDSGPRCRTELRRLYATADTGQLVALDSRARTFPAGLARFIDLRDQTCRTPYCDAPIRHRDHVVAHADGGPTSAENGQGLCAACNHAKQASGWTARAAAGPPGEVHVVGTTTPTGHRHVSRAPRAPVPLRR